MNGSGHDRTTPFVADGDGVRVIREHRPVHSATTVVTILAAAVIAIGIATLLLSRHPRTAIERGGIKDTAPAAAAAAAAGPQRTAPAQFTATAVGSPQRKAPAPVMPISRNPDDLPSGDPNDIATYVSPTDPVPTATEVIQALHDMGDHTGMGAFNPPGTSPPLRGLAVPDNFELPQGYVRHHQVTDEGEPLEPILMFSPDGVFVDASGRAIRIPDDRVVPPEMAPAGLPIREITIPPSP